MDDYGVYQALGDRVAPVGDNLRVGNYMNNEPVQKRHTLPGELSSFIQIFSPPFDRIERGSQ